MRWQKLGDCVRAWRYKMLKCNMAEFQSEGDLKFVTRGGPWLHRGDALIVAP